MYHKEIFELIFEDNSPEVTFYSFIEGELTEKDKIFLKEKLTIFIFNNLPNHKGIKSYVSFFEYTNNSGILLTIEHEWDVFENIFALNYQAIFVEWLALLLFQQSITKALFTCICHFPIDINFFGKGFSMVSLVISIDGDIYNCIDYGGNKSEKWTDKVKTLGKHLQLDNWSDL